MNYGFGARFGYSSSSFGYAVWAESSLWELRGTAEDGQFDTLLGRLKIDLDLLKKEEGVVPEAIVVSGDLAEWGMKAEFDDAFVLLDELSRHLGIRREHVAMIPGNHDLNRKTCAGYFATCEGDGVKPKPPYWPKWKRYVGMFQELYRGWRGCNSTMQESHEEGTHYGHVGEAQLRWFLGELARYSREEWVVLGLVHHNVVRGVTADDENLRDADDLGRILGGIVGFVVAWAYAQCQVGEVGGFAGTFYVECGVEVGAAAVGGAESASVSAFVGEGN